MFGTAMPEAAVHKERDSLFSPDKVGFSREQQPATPAGDAKPSEEGGESGLGAAVPKTPDERHAPGALILGQRVGHGTGWRPRARISTAAPGNGRGRSRRSDQPPRRGQRARRFRSAASIRSNCRKSLQAGAFADREVTDGTVGIAQHVLAAGNTVVAGLQGLGGFVEGTACMAGTGARAGIEMPEWSRRSPDCAQATPDAGSQRGPCPGPARRHR
jgi:hypothetical protein